MGRLKYFVIHCTATRAGVTVTADQVRHWHTDPPPGGRGWRQVGYQSLVMLDGKIETLVDNDYDGNIQPWEITNGAAGYNSSCIHVCYVGGLACDGRPFDTRTPAQVEALRALCRKVKARNPGVMIVGHNYINPLKACPCFNVDELLKTI
ncbi:MAG: N-acetylmuramoyl-L-alanine amidase [Bacteroidales bacterium]|jgi:hypothetical protein